MLIYHIRRGFAGTPGGIQGGRDTFRKITPQRMDLSVSKPAPRCQPARNAGSGLIWLAQVLLPGGLTSN